MKRSSILIYSLLFVLTATLSCKKDNDDKDINLTGTAWVGPFDIGPFAYPEFKLQFGEGKTLTVSIPDVDTWAGQWEKVPNSTLINIWWQEGNYIWEGTGELNADNTKIINGMVTRSPQPTTATFELTPLQP